MWGWQQLEPRWLEWGGRERSGSRCPLKGEPTGFVGGLDMSYEERGKRSKGAWKVLSSWQEGLSFIGPGSVLGTPA